MKQIIKKVLEEASMNMVEKRGSIVFFGENEVPKEMLNEMKARENTEKNSTLF